MMLGVELLEPFACNVRINLCRGNIRVTQQHLDHSQIGAVIEQMRGEGVAQGMR
jgi:hypothetical protein